MQKNLKNIFGNVTGLDDKSVDFLVNALQKGNLPGFDYLEFKQSLGALSELHMDEGTAYKSAFATASTMGLTKEKLLKTAEHYRQVLNQEKVQFDAALQNQMNQRVKGKQDEVALLKRKIEEYKAKVVELEKLISQSQATIDHADEDIQQSLEKIERTKESFEFTHRSIINQIDIDIQNIQQLL